MRGRSELDPTSSGFADIAAPDFNTEWEFGPKPTRRRAARDRQSPAGRLNGVR